MAFNLGLKYTKGGLNTGAGSGASGKTSFGRVVDVILDAFHPEYDNYGKSLSINGVFYRSLSTSQAEDTSAQLKFAFQSSKGIKEVPLKGEIVEIQTLASEERTLDPNNQKTYWTKIVPIWNHPHHNAYPDTEQDGEGDADLGKYFKEESTINTLQQFPGDITMEGRHGQSIRFTGTKFDSNPWIDNSNNGKPMIVISNGQKETQNGDETIIENVNEDPASIYLTSDHIIELEQANEKRDAWDSEPTKANQYKGNQVIINSGRLYFNSNEESILLSAKESIGGNAKTIHLDGEKYIALDADKIYLGKVALNKEDEPVLLGQTTIDWLDDFLSQFESVAKTMSQLPPSPPAAVAKLIAIGSSIVPIIPTLRNLLKNLPSKKVFTE